MKFTSEIVVSVAQGPHAFSADGAGVIEIPAEHVAKFADLIAAGVLVPVAEPLTASASADDSDGQKPAHKAKAKAK